MDKICQVHDIFNISHIIAILQIIVQEIPGYFFRA